jgi:hypothetical protein
MENSNVVIWNFFYFDCSDSLYKELYICLITSRYIESGCFCGSHGWSLRLLQIPTGYSTCCRSVYTARAFPVWEFSFFLIVLSIRYLTRLSCCTGLKGVKVISWNRTSDPPICSTVVYLKTTSNLKIQSFSSF